MFEDEEKGLWLVLTMVLFVACPAEKGRTESSGGESKKQKIGVVVSTLNNPFLSIW